MTNETFKNERIVSIDRARGLIVFSMVFFQLMERFSSLGFFSRIANHSNEQGILLLDGLTLADIGAPFFFFIIAMNYIPSFLRRKERDGEKNAYLHFIVRYLSILGFGTCIMTVEVIFTGGNDLIAYICLAGAVLALLSFVGNIIFGAFEKTKAFPAKCRGTMFGVLSTLGAVNICISAYSVYLTYTVGKHTVIGECFSR